MSNIKDKYINMYAKQLADEGRKLVMKAYQTATFNKNKTQNLRDSYGCAVFYNGKMLPNTKFLFTSRAIGGKYNNYTGEVEYGRSEINHFLDNYKTHTNGFELVVAVAMFYGYILEEKKGRLREKYVVISGIDSYMDELKRKTGGTIVEIKPNW